MLTPEGLVGRVRRKLGEHVQQAYRVRAAAHRDQDGAPGRCKELGHKASVRLGQSLRPETGVEAAHQDEKDQDHTQDDDGFSHNTTPYASGVSKGCCVLVLCQP